MTSRQINQTKPSIRRITSLEEYFEIFNYDSSDNESKKMIPPQLKNKSWIN